MMLWNKTNPAKVNPSEMNTTAIDHARLQQMIIVVLGMLTFAVFATSCTTQKSCSAYQQVEAVD
jgi:hypothetical protein